MTHALSHSPTSPRYALQVRIHPAFTMALKKIADRELMTISVFVRHLLVERLREEGIDLATLIDACEAASVADQHQETRIS